MQEVPQKDVERAFGIFQARFAIVHMLAQYWTREDLSLVMKPCIIIHDIIIEDEGEDTSIDIGVGEGAETRVALHERTCDFEAFVGKH